MTHIASALAALEAGDREQAKSMLVHAFDHTPGEAAALLARIAIEDGDFARAEALSRTALENFAPQGAITLADSIGRQGRRAEAELIALDAIPSNADSGLLRAVLGEQRVRQAKWDLGTQDFIDALSLDGRDQVAGHLWRVVADLTVGHQANKVPTARALAFLDRIEAGAPRIDERLAQTFAVARHAIGNRTAMPQNAPAMPRSPKSPPRPPPRSAPPASGLPPSLSESVGRPQMDEGTPSTLEDPGGDLITALRRDRQMNESLQDGLHTLGLPVWPSKNREPLDTIAVMAPKNLKIDRAEFQREHLNVTSGSVASEIIVERARQSLMLEAASGSANAPLYDNVGLTQLEVALWDGALERMQPIPDVYLGETKDVDARVLALGAFLGACVVKPGVATWSFAADPVDSTIETAQGDLEPFEIASRWVGKADKDDVVLEEFLGEARLLANLTSKFNARHDPTAGLEGGALALKLAELWLAFRRHPLNTSQNEVAETIRPLNVLPDIVFFALDSQFAPDIGPGGKLGREVAMGYVRRTGEFLVLSSRKHFARAIGILCGELKTSKQTVTILDLFSTFHRPQASVFRDPQRKPKLERRGATTTLQFGADIDGEARGFAIIHQPAAAAPWQLIEA